LTDNVGLQLSQLLVGGIAFRYSSAILPMAFFAFFWH